MGVRARVTVISRGFSIQGAAPGSPSQYQRNQGDGTSMSSTDGGERALSICRLTVLKQDTPPSAGTPCTLAGQCPRKRLSPTAL